MHEMGRAHLTGPCRLSATLTMVPPAHAGTVWAEENEWIPTST